ncbi:hypothetical protein MUN88_12940 [Gracilibacillus caseinilyticus]|uniref:PTS HPr component phosphorylation site n=1 Tax=Gracilibacillus caseinilyticus TaxID=2932256 RepID=A0ABY4ES35_9BACI|nr:hypothetical protein [Gracilibacillus caseinilyticus]UOQ46993.1 hypothetical protein MUN88_12940 [Gracilibacillus caseinilyticus]
MKEFLSEKLQLQETLTVNEAISIHSYQKNYNGDIYLLANHEIVELTNLTELVTFSLLLNEGNEIQIIVEGPNAKTAINNVKQHLTYPSSSMMVH